MRRAANPWDRFYRDQTAPWRGERSVAELMPLATGRVLELGAGNGKLLQPLAAAGADVVGLDISYHAMARLGGVLADASYLPWADGAFSLVLDVHCTGHLLADGRKRAAADKLRVLEPGGHLIVERLHPDDIRAGKGEQVEDGTRQLQDGRTTHFSTVDDIIKEHPGARVVSQDVARRTPRFGAQRVVRASSRVVFQV